MTAVPVPPVPVPPSAAAPVPVRWVAEIEPFYWLPIGLTAGTVGLMCGLFAAQDRRTRAAFAALDEHLPEPARTRPRRWWLWLPAGAAAAFAALLLAKHADVTVEVDGFGPVPPRALADGLCLAALGAFVVAACVRQRAAAVQWRGAGTLRLAAPSAWESKAGGPAVPPALRPTDGPHPAPGGWAFALLFAVVFLPISVTSLGDGEVPPLAGFLAVWIPLGVLTFVRRLRGMPGTEPAVADGGVWAGGRLHAWPDLLALHEAPAPAGGRAVAVMTSAGCVKFLLAPAALSRWDETVGRNRPDLRGLRHPAGLERQPAGEALREGEAVGDAQQRGAGVAGEVEQ